MIFFTIYNELASLNFIIIVFTTDGLITRSEFRLNLLHKQRDPCPTCDIEVAPYAVRLTPARILAVISKLSSASSLFAWMVVVGMRHYTEISCIDVLHLTR